MFEILGIAFKILLGIPTRYAGVCVWGGCYHVIMKESAIASHSLFKKITKYESITMQLKTLGFLSGLSIIFRR